MTSSTTPCRKICKFDQGIGLCIGCWRNLDEIARWGVLSDDEREAVRRSLPEREASFAGKVRLREPY